MKTVLTFNTIQKSIRIISLGLILCSLSDNCVAQGSPPKLKDSTNLFLINKAYDLNELQNGVIFWCEDALGVGMLFTDFKMHTGLGDDNTMLEIETLADSLFADEDSPAPGYYHTQYQQYYKGISVEGNTYTEHHDGEYVFLTTGFIIQGLNMSVTPSLSSSDALGYATTYIDNIDTNVVATWIWDSFPAALPEGELVIIYLNGGDNDQIVPTDYKLAYKFTIMASNLRYFQTIYIDAHSGAVLLESSNRHFDNGGFNHLYYGVKNDLDLKRKYNLFVDDWHLAAFGDGRNIYTTDDEDYVGESATDTYDQNEWGWSDMPRSIGDTYWGNDNWSATAAHYCAQKAWDFYKQIYNRNGTTGWGKHIRILADNYSKDTYYEYDKIITHDIDYIWVGRLNNNYAGTYDIIGHEFTHGIVQRSKPLPFRKASGAINESFADIFGFMIERYMFGGVNNWTIGEHATLLRDMENPNNIGYLNNGQPAYYQESGYWSNLSGCFPNRNNDFCGVHQNSGVQNRWFYLLSMGGSNTINGQNRSVTGIGIDKAARIAYYTMTNMQNYDQTNETFDVVRANSLAAAATLYGFGSIEYKSVCQAWYAVNVGGCIYIESDLNLSCLWKPNNKWNEIKSGLKENGSLNVKLALFPNPANNIIRINIEEPNKASNNDYLVSIFDLQGKKVFSGNYKNIVSQEISIVDLVSGVYIMNVTNGSWNKNIRFVKQ